MDLQFQDTLTRRATRLGGPRGTKLGMYICGPTVYAPSHVGHARTYLLFDMIKRFFTTQGFSVRHVQNYTDFEDKITRRATELHLTWKGLARREEVAFHRNMSALGIIPPDHAPRSSDFARSMIEHIQTLEKRKIAYRKGKSVYFDASAVPASENFQAEELLSAHAVPEDGGDALPEAEDPRDFVLWKPSRAPAPVWSSPWGPGMPGWHLECYVMASKYLALPMDLHGGGLDLVFPHHYAENLISLAFDGQPLSRHFLHGAFVTMGERKMSKSLGNLVDLSSALADYGPAALRLYLLGRPYNERLEFRALEARQTGAAWAEDQATFHALMGKSEAFGVPASLLEAHLAGLRQALASDIGIPQAFEALHETAESIRSRGAGGFLSGERRPGRRLLAEMEELLGLPLLPPRAR